MDAQKYRTKYTENDSVNFVKDNIKNSTDLNSSNSTKDFTIISSSSHKKIQQQNCNTAKIATLIIAQM